MALLKTDDVEWLAGNYPSLKATEDLNEIRGNLSFSAAYDRELRNFVIIRSEDDRPSGELLSATYPITVKASRMPGRLPKTIIEIPGYPLTGNRHFTMGESACLCGPSEEARYINEGISIGTYIETLVIPFLYGQKYFDKYNEWPFADYEHNTAGALHSYLLHGDVTTIPLTLRILRDVSGTRWSQIYAMLTGDEPSKGYRPCWMCVVSGKSVSQCHPEAWLGFKKLYRDLKLVRS